MGSDPGDELWVIHPLLFFALFLIAITDLAPLLQEGEPLQGQ